MTNEEMQKTMQFILEQQAQFTANQQQVEERVSRLETNMAEMAREVSQVTREVGQVTRGVGEVTRAQAHMNEVVAAVLDAHKHTEERLDAFIGVLERYISEDRNGKNGAEDAT
jgi:3-phenylpropionate/cinnamic acid dioxygenase small subunit